MKSSGHPIQGISSDLGPRRATCHLCLMAICVVLSGCPFAIPVYWNTIVVGTSSNGMTEAHLLLRQGSDWCGQPIALEYVDAVTDKTLVRVAVDRDGHGRILTYVVDAGADHTADAIASYARGETESGPFTAVHVNTDADPQNEIEHYFFYDAAGALVRYETNTGDDDNTESATSYQYDEEGQVVAAAEDLFDDGQVDNSAQYSEDEANRTLEERYDQYNDGNADEILRWVYDADENLVRLEQNLPEVTSGSDMIQFSWRRFSGEPWKPWLPGEDLGLPASLRRVTFEDAAAEPDEKALNIQTVWSGNVATLYVDGDLRPQENVTQLRETLATLRNANPKGIVLEWHNVSFVGSLGIRELITSYADCRSRGVRFGLANVQDNMNATFKIVGLTNVFEFYYSAEDAVYSFTN